ncbi:oxidoreductase [Archangium sp.]|uniref:oxidoreductase n=1 Tax=Archangium sp. TaxID=1872627 RepID=UPI002D6E30F6|nr:oxidoreductase [Archangium sp.]HYO53185.1 oxidoreductase [Archangium sp.]
MSNQAHSKSVLITGCSTGIGRATALRLAQAGWKVYATARGVEKLAELEKAGCRTLALDVMDEASMVEAVRQVEKEEGAVGVLINNAGYSQSGALETVDIDGMRRQFETNVFGLLRLTQLVLPGMRRQGWGKVVNIGSMGGKLTFPGGGAYHATKYAVEALSDALRFEVRGFGVDVVLIEPGLIRTEFSQAAVGSMSTSLQKADGPYAGFNSAVARSTQDAYVKGPLAKLGGEADDVAQVIQRAIEARRPRARYTVTASAKVLLMQRAMMSDGVWDAFLRTQFPQPGVKN